MAEALHELLSASKARKLPTPDERKAIREAANITQAEVAAVIGTSAQAVSQYEAGKRQPRGELRTRYSELLTFLAAASRSA